MLGMALDLDWADTENKCDRNHKMFLVYEECMVLEECRHGKLNRELRGCKQATETDHPNCLNRRSRWIEPECW